MTGTTVWHINADEPDLIDYDTSFKQDAQDAIYAPDAYRSSDHDPVIVGLDLTPPARVLKEAARDELAELLLPTGNWRTQLQDPAGHQPASTSASDPCGQANRRSTRASVGSPSSSRQSLPGS